MSAFDAASLPPSLISLRTEIDDMDGRQILASLPKIHARLWDACIPLGSLNVDNLPPFFVRLRDDQVGHLSHWLITNRVKGMTMTTAYFYWPWDYNSKSKLSSTRENWGPAYDGVWKNNFTGKDGKSLELLGGNSTPVYKDLGLPLTYTRNHKFVVKDITGSTQNATKKRKTTHDTAGEFATPQKGAKFPALAAELEDKLDGEDLEVPTAEAREYRLQSDNPQINNAVRGMDSLITHCKKTDQANAALKSKLKKKQQQVDLQDTLIRRVRGDWEVESRKVRTKLDSIADSMGIVGGNVIFDDGHDDDSEDEEVDECEKEDADGSEGTRAMAPSDGQGNIDGPTSHTKDPDELKMNEAKGHQTPRPSVENDAKSQTPKIKKQHFKKENSRPTSKVKTEKSRSPATSTFAKKPLWTPSKASTKSPPFEPKKEEQPDGTFIVDYTTYTDMSTIPPSTETPQSNQSGNNRDAKKAVGPVAPNLEVATDGDARRKEFERQEAHIQRLRALRRKRFLNEGGRRYQACVEEGEGERDS